MPIENAVLPFSNAEIFAVYPCTYRELKSGTGKTMTLSGISLYLQGTRYMRSGYETKWRYIPVPTGNAFYLAFHLSKKSVYPCTYRERPDIIEPADSYVGISLYLQGTLFSTTINLSLVRYIPVPTGNSSPIKNSIYLIAVYPCTYRELCLQFDQVFVHHGISLYLQGTPVKFIFDVAIVRYIPVPTGNSRLSGASLGVFAVYPCTYREL